MRFIDKEGGTLNYGEGDLFGEPWNPVGGSNWTFDHAVYDGVGSGAFLMDPFTGLVWPLMAERAEITVQAGLPVAKSLDWVTLNTADTITVPEDMWVDWDVANQKWITVGEKYPEGLTAKLHSVVVYRSDLFDVLKWHDGSPFSVADIVAGQILAFEQGNPESSIYDESYVPIFEQFQARFKGWKITSTDPLTVEWYDDQYQQDAELNAFPAWPGNSGFQVTWNRIYEEYLDRARTDLPYEGAEQLMARDLGTEVAGRILGLVCDASGDEPRWQCRDCIVLSNEEFFEKRDSRMKARM